jgi:hypothetical protein
VIWIALCARARGDTRPSSSLPAEEGRHMQIHDFAGMTGEEREALSRVLEAYESRRDALDWSYEMVPLTEERLPVYAAS